MRKLWGDNLAGILDRERARFKLNKKVSNEKEQCSRSKAVTNLNLINGGDLVVLNGGGDGRHNQQIADGQAQNKIGLKEVVGLQEDCGLISGSKELVLQGDNLLVKEALLSKQRNMNQMVKFPLLRDLQFEAKGNYS
ncbi:hypothetical protein COLO4_23429 [Corchorus olitorius]|uniref:Uncharacterized protein n=1 Tax=Corchorus olitorius TaxID=93759 RepID=A0A1R3IGS2_9ROSI|nr:hypothetical protein COLO4_23429 [Corchorus olitorius]